MDSLTKAEWETLKEAWQIWDRIKPALDDFDAMRAKASGRWSSGTSNYIGDISEKGLITHEISPYEDGWDSNSHEFTAEELLTMGELYAQHEAIAAVIDETRTKANESALKEQRRKMYEEMRKEFGDV